MLLSPGHHSPADCEGESPCSGRGCVFNKAAANDGEDDGEMVSIPAHKLVLMAKSTYFKTRLNTAVGDGAPPVLREHADSVDELLAMEAVVEFMYTEKLPAYCGDSWAGKHGKDGQLYDSSITRRLLQILMVSFNLVCVEENMIGPTHCMSC